MPAAFVQTLAGTSVKAAGTSLGVTTSTGTNAGSVIVAVVLFDNAATASKPVVSSISKGAGETANWVFLGAARSVSTSAGAFASGEMWAIKTTVAWNGGTVLTVTVDTSTTMMASLFTEFFGTNIALRSTTGTNYSTTTTAASATTTGTTPVVGDLALGFLFGSNVAAAQAGDNDTTGGSWSAVSALGSTGGNAATNNFGAFQYKVLTAASHQTYNNQAAMTAGNGSIVAVLQAVPLSQISQASYRFYDDGAESTSNALAPQDSAYPADLSIGNVNLQLRIRLQSTTVEDILNTDQFLLQSERNASGTWRSVGGLADNYPEYNAGTQVNYFTAGQGHGQSFTGDGGLLTRAAFWMATTGTPPGSLTAVVYAHTGTFGTTSGVGTGSPLATSTARSAALPNTYQWQYFDFDGTLTLANGTPYVIVVMLDTTGDASNTVNMRVDPSAPSHPGIKQSIAGGTWTATTSSDAIFRIYSAGAHVGPFDSANLTQGEATTNRLGAGTGSFQAGKAVEDGLVVILPWTGNNYTEVLFSITLLKAAFVHGDTLRFRVVRNLATTGLTYAQTPTVSVSNLSANATLSINASGAAKAGATAAASLTITATHTGTKYYLHTAASTVIGTMPPDTPNLASDVVAVGATTERAMDDTPRPSGGPSNLSLSTLAQTAQQTNWFGRWVAPLAAQTIPGGIWTLAASFTQVSSTSNLNGLAAVYIWRPSTGAKIIDLATLGPEAAVGTVGTWLSLGGIHAAPVDVEAGDLLVIEAYGRNSQATAVSTGNLFNYDSTTEGSGANPAAYLMAPFSLLPYVAPPPRNIHLFNAALQPSFSR